MEDGRTNTYQILTLHQEGARIFPSYLSFPVTLQGSYYDPHFIVGKTEAQGHEVTYLKSHSEWTHK